MKNKKQLGYIIFYSAAGCKGCEMMTELLERYSQAYEKQEVNTDISPERLNELYPNNYCCPLIVIDQKPVGGLVEMIKLMSKEGIITR